MDDLVDLTESNELCVLVVDEITMAVGTREQCEDYAISCKLGTYQINPLQPF
mgnify:FL=1